MEREETDLLELLGDHGEGFEDDLRSSCDGDNPLGTGAVGYINPRSTLDNRGTNLYNTSSIQQTQTPSQHTVKKHNAKLIKHSRESI